jgi:hypothetical protein
MGAVLSGRTPGAPVAVDIRGGERGIVRMGDSARTFSRRRVSLAIRSSMRVRASTGVCV